MVIAVGGIGDVVFLHPKVHEKTWKSVATGLPNAFFFDLHYNAACDTLIAGALGRGAWTVTSPFKGGSSASCPALPAAATTAQLTQTSVQHEETPRAPVPPVSIAEPPVPGPPQP